MCIRDSTRADIGATATLSMEDGILTASIVGDMNQAEKMCIRDSLSFLHGFPKMERDKEKKNHGSCISLPESLLRGMPFVDLAYLRKSDLRDNVSRIVGVKQAVPCR